MMTAEKIATSNQYVFILRAEGSQGPLREQAYPAEARLTVRDLATRVVVSVRAREISPYRHTLYLEGQAYRIMNVIRQH
jgi:hypothetical protein